MMHLITQSFLQCFPVSVASELCASVPVFPPTKEELDWFNSIKWD